MDTSAKYVRMCEKATELKPPEEALAAWPEGGHWFARGDTIVITGSAGEETISPGDIWLPRQDQLQQMVGGKSLTDLIEGFVAFCGGCGWDNEWYPADLDMDSMEQVWLSYIMWFKYAKRWLGSAWVDIRGKDGTDGQSISLLGPHSIP